MLEPTTRSPEEFSSKDSRRLLEQYMIYCEVPYEAKAWDEFILSVEKRMENVMRRSRCEILLAIKEEKAKKALVVKREAEE
ncbi:hypothetical protein RUND412_000117 [Rhizina undulata]